MKRPIFSILLAAMMLFGIPCYAQDSADNSAPQTEVLDVNGAVEASASQDDNHVQEKSADDIGVQWEGFTITSNPVAVITIDGKRYGNTPRVTPSLSKGEHTIELYFPSKNMKVSKEFTIHHDKATIVQYDLKTNRWEESTRALKPEGDLKQHGHRSSNGGHESRKELSAKKDGTAKMVPGL